MIRTFSSGVFENAQRTHKLADLLHAYTCEHDHDGFDCLYKTYDDMNSVTYLPDGLDLWDWAYTTKYLDKADRLLGLLGEDLERAKVFINDLRIVNPGLLLNLVEKGL